VEVCLNCGARVQQPAQFCPACGRRLHAASHVEEFRVVTTLFCDIADSVSLDSRLELLPLQRVMDRFFEATRQVVASHGGKVGTRRGDGVMAVFGIPVPHDDDALRAVRAAADLRDALSLLRADLEQSHAVSLVARIGVNTGTVLVRSDVDSLEEEVTGHAVNLAKRFEQAASPGGILIGQETYTLVRDAVRAERSEPLRLKGVHEPVEAYRLLRVLHGKPGRARQLDRPMIGRGLDQRLLQTLFDRTIAERSCHLVTILGPAGIGKSRLVDHFLQGLGDQAEILRGHCLSYGESATFWPIMEIVTQAVGIARTDPPDVVHERLAAPLLGDLHARDIALRVAQLLGLGEEIGLPGDTFSALRRLLEALARRRPMVMFIDDLHWAEPTLLDVIEHIAEFSRDTPILLLCVARQDELFKRRGHWSGGKLNVTSLSLSPLSETEGERLVTHLLDGKQPDPEVQLYISQRAQGYPLYIEELVEELVQGGVLRLVDGRWVATGDLDEVAMPREVQTLLSAWLGRLDDEQRATLERAAVVGKQFHVADITALWPGGEPQAVATHLEALARQDLIQRDHGAVFPLPAVEGGEGYSFRHILIRNVAYDRMTEEVRARRHELYADWVERAAGDRLSQFDELIATHLNEAYHYRRRLGPADGATENLARRAGERFAAAGHRAAVRADVQLTLTLLRRADRLLPRESPTRLGVLPYLANALQAAGELQDAMRVYEELIAAAELAGDERTAMHTALARLLLVALQDLEGFLRDGRAQSERAVAAFTPLGDDLGLAKAWYVRAYADWWAGRSVEAKAAVVQARGFAQKAADRVQEATTIRLYCLILLSESTSVDEVVRYGQEALQLARSTGNRRLEASMLTILAQATAMSGDFEKARDFNKVASTITLDLGELLTRAADSVSEGLVSLLEGNLTAAEQKLRGGYNELERMGATVPQVAVAVMLARVLLRQGRYEDAGEMTRVCERLAAVHQHDVQARWRSVRAVLLAHRSELEAAERLAREAVALAERTDHLDTQAEVYADLAETLRMAKRREEAIQELERALRLYQRKGNEAGAKTVRSELITLRR
jgi:class 3 adenylate cyclase/tetratricopeptide (TPR) repeat protein